MSDVRPTVFVVDDEPSVLRGLGHMFEGAGHAVETFARSRQLLDRRPGDEPGCVVLGLRMPELNGLEAQEALVGIGCGLPVVFVSDHGDVPAAVKAMKVGNGGLPPRNPIARMTSSLPLRGRSRATRPCARRPPNEVRLPRASRRSRRARCDVCRRLVQVASGRPRRGPGSPRTCPRPRSPGKLRRRRDSNSWTLIFGEERASQPSRVSGSGEEGPTGRAEGEKQGPWTS